MGPVRATVVPIGGTNMRLPCALRCILTQMILRWAGGVLVGLYSACIAGADVVQ